MKGEGESSCHSVLHPFLPSWISCILFFPFPFGRESPPLPHSPDPHRRAFRHLHEPPPPGPPRALVHPARFFEQQDSVASPLAGAPAAGERIVIRNYSSLKRMVLQNFPLGLSQLYFCHGFAAI